MQNPKPFLVAAGIFILLLAALICWQQFVVNRLAAENRQLRGKIDALLAEDAPLAAPGSDFEELQRLREGQAELLRSRGELARLRRELQEAEAIARNLTNTFREPQREPSDLPFESYLISTWAKVAWSEVLVAGAWKNDSGKRVLLLIQPLSVNYFHSEMDVQTWIVELPDEMLVKSGLEALRSGARNIILSATQAAALLETLNQGGEIRMVSSAKSFHPFDLSLVDNHIFDGIRISLPVSAMMSPLLHHRTPSSKTLDVRLNLEVFPTLSADRESVTLVLSGFLNCPRNATRP